jgi:hypothetical protein
MKNKTIQKLILSVKKEIDNLLVTKSMLEEKMICEQKHLNELKQSFKMELELATQQIIYGFNSAEFIKNELIKQHEKELDISTLNREISTVLEEIVNKNINKKTYEHILEQIITDDNIKEAKAEMELIDTYSLISFNKTQDV